MLEIGNPYVYYGKPLLGSLLACAAMAGLILALGGESLRESYWQYVAINTFYLTLLGFLIWLVFDVRNGRFKFPAVKKFIEDQRIIVCSYERWLGYDAQVTLYRQDDDYERPLATGIVSNVQANGLVQIQVTSGFATDDMEALAQVLKGIQLKEFIIKPAQDWRR